MPIVTERMEEASKETRQVPDMDKLKDSLTPSSNTSSSASSSTSRGESARNTKVDEEGKQQHSEAASPSEKESHDSTRSKENDTASLERKNEKGRASSTSSSPSNKRLSKTDVENEEEATPLRRSTRAKKTRIDLAAAASSSSSTSSSSGRKRHSKKNVARSKKRYMNDDDDNDDDDDDDDDEDDATRKRNLTSRKHSGRKSQPKKAPPPKQKNSTRDVAKEEKKKHEPKKDDQLEEARSNDKNLQEEKNNMEMSEKDDDVKRPTSSATPSSSSSSSTAAAERDQTNNAQTSEAEISGKDEESKSDVKMPQQESASDSVNKKDTGSISSSQATEMKEHTHGEMLHYKTATSVQKEEVHELERGKIVFLFRPKVELSSVSGINDVQRFHILLYPQQSAKSIDSGINSSQTVKRLIVIGKKHLPAIPTHERLFAFVEKASVDLNDINKLLEPYEYNTMSMGERHVGGDRPIAEGTYAIVEHHGHTNLAYAIRLPHHMGPAQQAFNIESQGSFVLSIRNPHQEPTERSKAMNQSLGLSQDRKVQYPHNLQEMFENYRWIPVRDTRLLDFDNVELLFVGAKQDIVVELGDEGEALIHAAKGRIDADQVLKAVGLSQENHDTAVISSGEFK